MISSVVKNSFLIIALIGLLFLPVLGSQFIEYVDTSPEVLGVQSVSVVAADKAEINIVDQVDLGLNLSDDPIQKFYNILPEDYVNSGYKTVLVVAERYEDQGVFVELVENDLSTDLEVVLDPEEAPVSLDATLLIIK